MSVPSAALIFILKHGLDGYLAKSSLRVQTKQWYVEYN